MRSRRQRIIVIILLLVACMLGFSLLLLPDHREVALMQWQDSNYTQAFSSYEKLKDSGDYSPNVVIPLISLYKHYGSTDKAVALMEEFIRRNPDSVEARRQLVDLYDSSQRLNDYCRALEELQKVAPSVDNLRALADNYDFLNRYDDHQSALERLIKTDGYTPKEIDYQTLAQYYAQKQRYADALKLIRQFARKNDYHITSDLARFAVRMAFEQGEKKEAYEFAEDYVDEMRDPQKAGDLAALLADYHEPKQALALLKPYKDKFDTMPSLYAQYITLRLLNGEEEEIFRILSEQLKADKLPVLLSETYLDLSLKRKDYAALEEGLRKAPLELLPEESLWDYTEAALLAKQPGIAAAIASRSAELGVPPLLAALLNVAAEDTEEHVRAFLAVPVSATLPEKQKRLVALMNIRHGAYGAAYGLLQQSSMADQLQTLGGWQVADLYLHLSKGAEALSALDNVDAQSPQAKQADGARGMLLAGLGKLPELRAWMEAHADAPTPLLNDMHSLAEGAKQREAAIYLAERIYQRDPTPENRLQLAETLLQSKKYAAALPHLEALRAKNKQARELYVQTLIGMVQQGENVAPDAVDKALTELMNMGGRSTEELENMAYMLADMGRKERALDIFISLAENKPFESSPVKEALYLMGDKPDDKSLSWIERRARMAPPDDQAAWLRYLIGIGQQKRVALMYMDGMPEPSPDALRAYITALSDAKESRKLADLLSHELQRSESLDQIREYAKLAEGENLDAVAQEAWKRVYHLSPGDAEANRRLGLAAVGANQYDEAEKHLGAYLKDNKGDYATNYAYAETLQRQKNPSAKTYYERAYAELDSKPSKDFEDRFAQARLLQKLGRMQESKILYKELIDSNPNNTSLKADYANLLVEMRDFKEASQFLSTKPEETPQ